MTKSERPNLTNGSAGLGGKQIGGRLAQDRSRKPLPRQSKGEQSRERILRAALRQFGERGYELATTRQIAAEAGLQFPAISHYFGDKHGLYMACAKHVVASYHQDKTLFDHMRTLLGDDIGRDVAREQLSLLLRSFRTQLAGFDDKSELSQFIVKDMHEGGPAFDLFYQDILEPALAVLVRLIQAARPQISEPTARVEALMLVGGVSTFGIGAPVVARFLGNAFDDPMCDDILNTMLKRLYG